MGKWSRGPTGQPYLRTRRSKRKPGLVKTPNQLALLRAGLPLPSAGLRCKPPLFSPTVMEMGTRTARTTAPPSLTVPSWTLIRMELVTSVMTTTIMMVFQTWCLLDQTTADWSPTRPKRIATVSGLSPGLHASSRLPLAGHKVTHLSQVLNLSIATACVDSGHLIDTSLSEKSCFAASRRP